ncbi:MAG: YjbQ family protein [Thaumarchaeota archaeon]|nr:YjbQ family protein [Nitrososphaerota archaeon]
MEGYFGEIRVRTSSRIEFRNITSDVRRIVEESGVRSGIAAVYTPHTTTAIFVNEDEGGLKGDLMKVLEKLIPVEGGYEHDLVDDNAFAHLRSIIVNPSITIPIRDGRLMLGTWQSIFLAEFDGPRTRTVYVQVLGFR